MCLSLLSLNVCLRRFAVPDLVSFTQMATFFVAYFITTFNVPCFELLTSNFQKCIT